MATTRSKAQRRPDRRRSPGPRRERLVFAAALVLVVPVLVWAVVQVAGDDGSPGGPAGGDPGVAHVHGLGVNPADGSLYVATHYGMFRIEDESPARRVGESFQDTMGFTVAGPDHFLGSGHPDPSGARQGQPGRLGLIESTDAGESWAPRSLSGEVDFHALAFAHGRTYGWDSGSRRFMVAADQRTWDTRSTVLLLDFAVDPADPDRIVGAGPDGLVQSDDGGRTWRGLSGPALVALSWDQGSGLVGADADGAVHRSTERGASWSEVGRLPGSPQAFLATGAALFAAADDDSRTGIYRSTDGGRTWDLRYRDAE